MKKIVFYIPAILFVIIYGWVAIILSVGSISPIILIWIGLFLIGGFLLNKEKFWGGIVGALPAIHLIYMGTQETGQIISETPIGIVVFAFYIICGFYVYRRKL